MSLRAGQAFKAKLLNQHFLRSSLFLRTHTQFIPIIYLVLSGLSLSLSF